MNFLFASSHRLAIPIAKSLSEIAGFKGCLTNPDKPKGRNRELQPNDFSSELISSDFGIFKPGSDFELKEVLLNYEIDLVVTCAYGKLITDALLVLPKYGWLNIHFSHLPKFRGAAPVQRAIWAGESNIGFSIFKMDSGLDTGDIAVIRDFEFNEHEKASEVLRKLTFEAIPETIKIINNIQTQVFTKQAEFGASNAPKISRPERKIVFSNLAAEEFLRYRAMDMNGGVYGIFRGAECTLSFLEIREKDLPVGQVVVSGKEVLVGFLDRAVVIDKVKFPGKKEMSAIDWINGARIHPGERFE